MACFKAWRCAAELELLLLPEEDDEAPAEEAV